MHGWTKFLWKKLRQNPGVAWTLLIPRQIITKITSTFRESWCYHPAWSTEVWDPKHGCLKPCSQSLLVLFKFHARISHILNGYMHARQIKIIRKKPASIWFQACSQTVVVSRFSLLDAQSSAPARSNDRCFPGFTSEPAAPGLLAEKKNKLSTNNLANIFQKGTVNCLISNPLAIASIRLKGSWLLREL